MIEDIKEFDGDERFKEYLLSLDRGILHNNSIVPFLVSSLESFLKEFISVQIKNDVKSKNKVFQKVKKIDSEVVQKLLSGELKIENWYVRQHNFQNLNAANTIYRDFLGIDLFKVLGKRKQYKNKRYIVREKIQETIQLRHKIIHNAHIDISLNKEKIELLVTYFLFAGDLFAEEILKKHQIAFAWQNDFDSAEIANEN